MGNNFIIGDEFGLDFVKKVTLDAIAFKNNPQLIPKYPDKSALFLFFNESLRTRISSSIAAQKMQMSVICENMSSLYKFETENVPMNSDKPEHIKEAARVLSRYSDIIGLRNSNFIGGRGDANISPESLINDDFIYNFASFSKALIVNLESDAFHPMQGLADLVTMAENFENNVDFSGKKVVITYAPHIKHLPIATPQSQILSPAMLGANVTLACPPGFELSTKCLDKVAKYSKSFNIEYNQNQALSGADVVIAKSWLSLENLQNKTLENSDDYYTKYQNWMLDLGKMNLTNNALFMHCLPVRRDIEVSSNVLDCANSVIINEAENRLWSQISLMHNLFLMSDGKNNSK